MRVARPSVLPLQPVDRESFRPFGHLIEKGRNGVFANEGTALRHDIHAFDAGEGGLDRRLVTSIFDARPRELAKPLAILERHPQSQQLIMPLGGNGHAVIVCRSADDGAPIFSTLAGFRFGAEQGVILARGVWHHPITALGRRTQFLVQSWQSGDETDCEVITIEGTIVFEDATARS